MSVKYMALSGPGEGKTEKIKWKQNLNIYGFTV